ncbi:MAG: GldG family protein [Candidatus Sericytochromatia bacterium]|nr:GldG family protein [Candidatus Sericytochromatia bacterium]
MATSKPKPKANVLDRVGWIVLFAGLLALVARRWLPIGSAALFDAVFYGGVSVAALGALLLVYANLTDLTAVAKTRQVKHGANSLVLTISVIGLIGLVNYLGSRYHMRFDLTEAKTFSLSDQTKKILGDLKDEVKVTAFYQENNPSLRQVKDLMSNYTYYSKQLKVTYIDPDRQPAVAQQYGVERYGTTIFEKGDRKEKVTGVGEQDFTSALIKLIKKKETKVYFVNGHGELALEEMGDKGAGKLKEALGKDHYATEALSLPTKQDVPLDADVVVIAGPKSAYTQREADVLDKWLAKGGKLLAMIDPGVESGLDPLFAKYGITLGKDLVIDPIAHSWTDVATPAVTAYKFHDITKSLAGTTTFFPRARSVSLAAAQPTGQLGTVLAETSPAGWGETDMKNPQAKLDKGVDLVGPVPLGVAVNKDAPDAPKPKGEEKAIQTRLVVFGNSVFIANTVISQNAANADLALNAVNWLAQEESLIAIRPKAPANKQITLTGGQMNGIFTLSVLGMPLAVLALGAFIWFKRR